MTRDQFATEALLHGLRICGPCKTCHFRTKIHELSGPYCRWHSRVIQDPESEGCTAWQEEQAG